MHLQPKHKGILLILLSAAGFDCMNVCVRMAGDVPTVQKCFFRNAVAFLVVFVLLLREGEGIRPQERAEWRLLLARAAFGTAGLLANFYAVDHLLLADATMLNKMSPFFAVLVSWFLLKERISPVQALFLAGAFGGAMFIVKPSLGNLDLFPSVIGLLGGLGAGAAYSCVRLLGQRGVRKNLIIAFFSGFSCLVTLPYVLIVRAPMTMVQLLWLLGAGCFATAAQICITGAYCHAPAREISVYDYAQVIFSALLGYVFFGDIPDGFSILGYLIICGIAVLTFWYNNRAHTEKNPAA